MTTASIDRDLVDVLAPVKSIDIRCDARRHTGDETAVWVVRQVVCCPNRPEIGLICDPCLRRILTTTRPVRCRDCGHVTPIGWQVVLAYEPIDQAAS